MKARKCLPLLMFGQCGDSFGQLLPLVQFLNTFAVLPGVWGFGVACVACGPAHGRRVHGSQRHQLAGETLGGANVITRTIAARSKAEAEGRARPPFRLRGVRFSSESVAACK